MDVLLAAPPHKDTFGYSMPPPGLLRLAGALRARGCGVRCEDLAYRLAAGELRADDGLADGAARLLLARGAPDVLGLSTMGATLPMAVALAERVRARAPRTRLVLGGPGTTGIDAALLERFPWLDAVVRGEAEETLPLLLDAFAQGRGGSGVAGVTWRRPDGSPAREADRPPLEDLDLLPPYAWDLFPDIAAYKRLTGEEEGLVPLDSGRGCVYDCSFCTIGRFWRRRSRPLPAARLAAEVAALKGMPGARSAYLCHDIFGADRRHALEVCDALLAVGVPWECRARVDHLDRELIARMGRAGCYRVLLGVESGDHEVREAHGKRMSPAVDVVEVVSALAEHGITPILSLILGLPGEDEPARERTLALALAASLRAGCNLSFHLVNPQPGCRLGEEHAERSLPVDGIPPDMAQGAGTTAPERALIAAHPDLFSTFALLTSGPGGVPALRALHALATALPPVLMSRPRTVALLRLRLGLDVLALYRAWRASGLSFDAFAARQGDPLVGDLAAWERAVETASDRPVLVRSAFDLAAVARALTAGAAPVAARAATRFAVVRRGRAVRTLAVSEDVARLLERPPASLSGQELAFLASQGLAPPAGALQGAAPR